MARFVARRLLAAAQTLAVLSILLFLWLRLLPGGPATALLGERATPDRVASLNRVLRLDEPQHLQYLEFVRRAVTGDLGTSLVSNEPVVAELARAVPATVELSVAAMLIAVGLGIPLGYVTAHRRSTSLN